MKKLIMMLAIICGMVAMTGCTPNDSTPKGAAEKFLNAMIKQDSKTVVSMIYGVEEQDQDDIEEAVEVFTERFNESDDEELLKSYEILSEKIDKDDPERATVKVKMTMRDGSTSKETLRLRKSDDGKWRVRI